VNAKPHLLGKTNAQQRRQMDSNWVPAELPDEEDKLPLHLPRQEPQESAMANADTDLNDEQWGGVKEPQSENQTDILRDKWPPLIVVIHVLLQIGHEPVQSSKQSSRPRTDFVPAT
jgi:hypothetical protein